MADQNTKAAIQYFDYQLITKQSPGINDRYTDIINYCPVKIPFYNDSFKTKFSQGQEELPDSSYISLIKRLGFAKIKLWERNAGGTVLSEDTSPNKWMFTDTAFVDGIRYMFAVYYDYSRMRIYKQIGVTENPGCGSDSTEPTNIGNFVNITKYGNQYYFPFSKCLYDKFTVAQFGKGQSKDSGEDGIIRNELLGDYLSVQTLLYDTVHGNIGAGPGDYICLYSGSLSTQMGYVAANGISTTHSSFISNCVQMSSPFFGMYKIKAGTQMNTMSDSVVTESTLNSSIGRLEESEKQKWKVFSEYGDVLSFVTADGIFILNYSDTKPSESEFTYEGATFFDTNFGANPAKYVISSMILHNSSICYYDIKSGRIFSGLQGVSKFYFDSRNAYEFGKQYTDLVTVSGVVLLIGDSALSMMKPTQAGEGIVTYVGFVPLSMNVGYFSRNSFTVEDGVFYIFNSKRKLFGWTFTSYYEVVTPAPKEIPVLYASDLTVLMKGRESVSLSVESGDIYILISHEKIVSSQIKGNTKIILLNSGCSMRHKRMVSGIVMKGYRLGAWYGNNIYSQEGNKDYNSFTNTDEYYKTILKVQVGDESLNYTKTIAFNRTILGYNSFITKGQTVVKHNIDLGGWHWELKFGDLWRDDYVTNIMKLWKTGNTGTNFKNYPIGIAMKGGNGVGLAAPQERLLESEFTEFDAYAPVNISDSNELADFTVSKMSTFQINLNIPMDHLTAEYITYGDNALEIGGVLFGYTIDAINQVRFGNNSTQQDSFYSGPTGNPLTDDSGNESEVA